MSAYKKPTIRMAVLFAAILPLLLFLVSCTISDPFSHDGEGEASEDFSYAYASAGIRRLTLHGVNGNIVVEGRDGADSIFISGKRMVRSESDEDAETHLQLLSVEIRKADQEFDVHTRQPNQNEGKTYQIDYRVRLPRGIRIAVESTNGEVEVSAVSDSVGISQVNGNIRCTNLSGDCTVGLVNGQITCDVRLPVGGLCTLNTVNGNVSLSVPDTTSAQLEAKVSNGTVSVSNLTVGGLKSSRTAVSGVLGSGEGTIRLSAVNGNVAVAGMK
jgi:hypothetical protein